MIGDHELATDLRGWINEGLMTLFFLVVGLEAKRELDLGELRERTRLAIPVVASLGGMVDRRRRSISRSTPAATARSGWGVAVSTDTALALGALSLLTRGRAIRLRVFLLTVVVIDDLVALLVIALGYSEDVSVTALAVAVGLFGVLLALRWAGSWRGPAAVLVGVGIWFAMFESGVDAVIAGLAIGLITSAYPPRARAARAQHRAGALVPRAADAGAGLLGATRGWCPRSRPTSACSTGCTRGRAG